MRAWVLVVLQLRCVVVAFPHGDTPREREGNAGRLSATMSPKMDELLNIKDSLQRHAAPPHKKAPQFMVDLFSAVSKSPPRSQKDILDGNVVRSFQDKGHTGEKLHFFNISSFSRDERMIKAEFRWFRQKQKYHINSFGHHFYKVDLYEVLDSRVKPWRGNLITSRLVPLYTQGWEVFNVTQMVSKWISNSQENNGILVVTTLPSAVWPESSSPKRLSELADRNAYLVVFSDDVRTEITANKSAHLEHGHMTSDPPANEQPHNRRRRAAPNPRRGRPESCQRVPLFIDFEEIGWAGWIISPRGYNAYHCRGPCPFPLGESQRATNHATVQSIMHALKLSNDVGSPCCVPDKLQSLSLLYFDDEENVVLKQYDDMVAVSCGCH